MDAIYQKFLQAEQDFLLAAQSDDQLLAGFAERWQSLQSDWESLRPEADSTTRQPVDAVATRIEELAGDLYLVKSRTLSLKVDLLSSLEDVFASLTLEEGVVAHTNRSPQTKSTHSSLPDSDILSPSRWLLRNLHNPYPLPHIQFSTQSAGSKLMKNWFAKARQRIGWTRLLRDRFAGCRSLAAGAAFRAFVRDDPTNPLDADLKTAFLAIKSHAELVYGDEEAPSPSLKRQRSISPTPSLTFSSGSEDSDDERCPTPSSDHHLNRPLKRARMNTSPRKRRRIDGSLPPPRSQIPNSLEQAGLPPAHSKKRRLSESDSDTRPKHPRGIQGCRLHTVSDPLTVPAWFDFDESFQIPNPASTGALDSSSFDVDFFNPPPLPSYSIPSVPAPSPQVHIPADDFSSLFEIPQLDLLQFGLPDFDPDWTEFLNCEPDLSLFLCSSSSASPLAETPPLVDDVSLSPSSHPNGGPSTPNLLHALPHPDGKNTLFPAIGEPLVQEEDFRLPPGEGPGIPSAALLLSLH